jgi:LPS sulfotransferase NodH
MQKFVIVGMPRVGSNFIVGMLNRHPDILCHYELANPSSVIGPMAASYVLTQNFRDSDPMGFVSAAFEVGSSKKAVGFKIFGGDVSVICEYVLKESQIKKILISRPNILAAFSSQKIAIETGIWGARTKDDLSSITVAFDISEFEHYRTYAEGFFNGVRKELAQTGQDHLEIFYDFLHSSDQKSSIYSFLGVDIPAQSGFDSLKQNSPRLLDRFSNPQEVASYIADIGKEAWLIE